MAALKHPFRELPMKQIAHSRSECGNNSKAKQLDDGADVASLIEAVQSGQQPTASMQRE
jgi:hypothetical protein